ncbi:hypothetical protein [Luteimonas kalidii]|uniref:CvpA family protein n=1 Tax=Luteimonas kalidii TaxID=3042025 RepID=A0ABT6JQS8_9GAMM|nr:hypothetical protein [Luteimonas kalidii]MDH5832486.1 hypothetical protein [Luteimonas kalidii]
MSWMGLVLLVLGAYLAYKLVGALLKIVFFVLALVGAYWFLAPHLGWPTVSELVYVLGPDFGGRRIEEVLQPSSVAGEVAGRVADQVADGVMERVTAPGSPPEVAPADQPAPPVPADGDVQPIR